MIRDTVPTPTARHRSGATAAESSPTALEVCAREADDAFVSGRARPRRMPLRYPDRCAACQADLPAGTTATWHPGPRVVTCLECQLEGVPVDPGIAGASARREYDRRHTAREDHARQKLGKAGVLLARVIDEPQSTRAWKAGAAGEERAGKRLTELLAGTDVRLLHDRRMPGRGAANIDHIAIGPGGITVIDTKNHRGKVRTERIGGLFCDRRTVLLIDGRDRSHLIDGVEKQIAAVRTVVDRLSDHPLDIRGALCFASPDGLPLLKSLSVRDVLVDGTRATAKLADRPGSLGSHEIAVLHQRLAAALPAA